MGCVPSQTSFGLDMSKLTLKQLQDLSTGDLSMKELDERNMRIFALTNGQTWTEYLLANGLSSQIVGKFSGTVTQPGSTPYNVVIVLNEATFKGGTVEYPELQAKGCLTYIQSDDDDGTMHYDEVITDIKVQGSCTMQGKVSLKLLDSGNVKYYYGDVSEGITGTLSKI